MIYNEDCLEGMKRIPDGSVDCILTDLPFGITDAPFDKRLPFEPLWKEFYRVTKKNAAMILFANSKFLIELAASNLKHYRYKWCWVKPQGTGFLNAKKMPLKVHEDILIFYQALPTYNPQFTKGKPYKTRPTSFSLNYQHQRQTEQINDGRRYPLDTIYYATPRCVGSNDLRVEDAVHPTQKPVALLEYLIKTYTNEGETVLDATMGSGSTGVACVNLNQEFIGFELEKNFFDIAQKRIGEALAKKAQELF